MRLQYKLTYKWIELLMIIEVVEAIIKEHSIFSYEYNKIANCLSLKDDIVVSPLSKQLELIKITNAFISCEVTHRVDKDYTIHIIE